MKWSYRVWCPLQPSLSHPASRGQHIHVYKSRNVAQLLMLLALFLSSSAGQAEFPGQENVTEFLHMELYQNQVSSEEMIYIGAKNELLQLTSDFALVERSITGPREDSIDCDPQEIIDSSRNCTVKSMADNFNKILLVDEKAGNLIACGSIYQGTCELRSLSDISNVKSSPRDGDTWVTPNSHNSTTLAFLVPNPKQTDKLAMVVGVTYSQRTLSPFTYINTLSTRNVNGAELFHLVDDEGGIKVKTQKFEEYKIYYRAGFQYEQHIYLITNQKYNLTSTEYVSKIIQICDNDTNYNSLMDMELVCDTSTGLAHNDGLIVTANIVNSSTGDDLLVASFTNGTDPENLHPSDSTTVCLFPLSDIRSRLRENLAGCYNASNKLSAMDYYWEDGSDSTRCLANASNLIPDYVLDRVCNVVDAYKGIIGSYPLINSSPAYVIKGEKRTITAIQSLLTDDKQTVIFLGTSDGHILKMWLNETKKLVQYEDVTIDEGYAINSDLLLSSDESHLYVMTKQRVRKISLHNCSTYTNQKDCRDSKDPFCGWCVMEQNCSLWKDCKHNNLKNYWLSAVSSQQLSMLTSPVYDNYVNIEENPKQVTLVVENLPQYITEEMYKCVFSHDHHTMETNAACTTMSSGCEGNFTCSTPATDKLRNNDVNKDFKVGLKSNKLTTGLYFVSTSFYFVNCSKIQSCRSCMNSKYACIWCLYGSGCHYNHTRCPTDFPNFVSSAKYTKQVGTSIPPNRTMTCPTFTEVSQQAIPNNVPTALTVMGKNLPQPKNGFEYRCQIKVDNREQEAFGHWNNSQLISCESRNFNYTATGGENYATLRLKWRVGQNNSFIVGEKIVTLYKCDILGKDCSICGSYNAGFRENKKPYGCKWCGRTLKCHHNSSNCRIKLCPRPSIVLVSPNSTHTRGGTIVTIRGKELGRGASDVEYVHLANNIICKIQKFTISTSLACSAQATTPRTGRVIVKVKNISQSTDNPEFFFADPKIDRIHPMKGPLSGGTRLTLYGKDLLVGGASDVMLGNVLCDVQKQTSSETELVCSTRQITQIGKQKPISIKIGNQLFNVSDESSEYDYTLDPTLFSMEPKKSFDSGGRQLNITGTHFDSIQDPMVFLRVDDMCSKPELCKHSAEKNSSVIHCLSPPKSGMSDCSSLLGGTPGRRRRQAESSRQFTIAFVMDGVDSVRSPNISIFRIEYFHDPEYYNITGEYKPGNILTILGSNLTLASKESDIQVFVCNLTCEVTRLQPDKVSCRMPDQDPGRCLKAGPGVEPGKGNPENNVAVAVKVGNLEVQVGTLVIVVTEIDPTIIIAPVCVVFVLMIIIIGLLVRIRIVHQRQKKERDKYQLEYEMLERRVRNEARIEFAELQQEIQLVTGDLISAGIPYKDLHLYTFAVLFPFDVPSDNPMLRDPHAIRGDSSSTDEALKLLDSMINNKFFLLTTLQTLESQKRMNARDKSQLANVLTVILLSKLGYLMEIWKELLVEHVSKLVDKKTQKHLMRRNETIVEKLLSNWLSLCMYDNMKNHTGSSLYVLYKATEMLTEYGPVDAVTGEAHYTLSEERLLKETVETNPLTIQVSVNQEVYACKVLDCDTINQAKQKFLGSIYKSTPASQRPGRDDIDLEWQCGQNGRLNLTDFDNTTVREGEWRKVNTLKHYNVMSNANMALISKDDEGIESDSPYANFVGGRVVGPVEGHVGASTSMSISAVASDDIHVLDMDSTDRVWHLVRKEDEDERKHRVIDEIYLTRLMSTKVPLKSFIDNFMETVLNVSHIPKAVKFLFDLYDDLAKENGLDGTDYSHIWKSNSLPIRYWANLLRFPQNGFDITEPDVAEPSLEVLAQCLIDSCSLDEIRMGKDSPPSKLLFSRDMQTYRTKVRNFYNDISDCAPVTPQQVTEEVTNISMKLDQRNIFNTDVALREFFKTIKSYDEDIISALEDNSSAKNLKLGHKLEELMEKMEEVKDVQ